MPPWAAFVISSQRPKISAVISTTKKMRE